MVDPATNPQPATSSEPASSGLTDPLLRAEQDRIDRIAAFNDPHQEWRRLAAEFVGTFFLVIVAAGAPMMGQAFPGSVSRSAAVVAPGLMVMAIIMSMGKVAGAHLNPAVSFAFALRGDFPWKRVPGYVIVQMAGATAAALVARGIIDVSSIYGATVPAAGHGPWAAMWLELVLTFGLLTVILGTASGAQNIGIFGAIGVGGYIALAGLWGSPISGASMNPARTFGPEMAAMQFHSYWAYLVGPFVGAALAVAFGFVLRGHGGGKDGSVAAQGTIATKIGDPDLR